VRSATGQYYVAQYYDHGPALVGILARRPDLGLRTQLALRSFSIQARRATSGKSAILSRASLESADALLRDFAFEADPQLRRVIVELRELLKSPKELGQFGFTIEVGARSGR